MAGSQQLSYGCPAFIKAFVNSRTAEAPDDIYGRLQWAGEEYVEMAINNLKGIYRQAYDGFFSLPD